MSFSHRSAVYFGRCPLSLCSALCSRCPRFDDPVMCPRWLEGWGWKGDLRTLAPSTCTRARETHCAWELRVECSAGRRHQKERHEDILDDRVLIRIVLEQLPPWRGDERHTFVLGLCALLEIPLSGGGPGSLSGRTQTRVQKNSTRPGAVCPKHLSQHPVSENLEEAATGCGAPSSPRHLLLLGTTLGGTSWPGARRRGRGPPAPSPGAFTDPGDSRSQHRAVWRE